MAYPNNGIGETFLRARRARKVRRDSPIHTFPPMRNGARTRFGKRAVPIIAYDTALTESAYGKPEHLGDLFNDIVGAVVPGWGQRPDWMKKIVVKPDPNKLLNAALKVAPPKTVQNVLTAAEQAGLNTYYGGAYVSPEAGAALYGTGAALSYRAAGIPMWAWLAGGGVLVLFLAMRR